MQIYFLREPAMTQTVINDIGEVRLKSSSLDILQKQFIQWTIH